MDKPRLLFFFNGLPEYETLFNIAVRLKERGKVEPICFSPLEILRREPRFKPMIAASGLDFTVRLNRWFKLFPKRWLRNGDAVITMVDPTLDFSATRPRSLEIVKLNMPTIFVQHGVMQGNFNVVMKDKNLDYMSELLLVFEALISSDPLSSKTKEKIEIVGFLKPVMFEPRQAKGRLPEHNRSILFCHSFRWEGRYGEEDITRFYNLVSRFAKAHPDDLIIIRSHRGKSRKNYKKQDKAVSKLKNIIFSHAYEGPLAGMTMTDVLGLADMCVSTSSTAVLDSVYMNKPTAIYENDQPVFQSLPNITDFESLENFYNNPECSTTDKVQEHYGCIEENIELSCNAIEKMMIA